MPLSKEYTEGYLGIKELDPRFTYEYHNGWNESVESFLKMLLTEKAFGIDTEFHLRNNKATYLQLSTPTKGLVLNIRNYKFRHLEPFKALIKQLFENKEILKVGLNLSCDVRVLKQAFFGEIDFVGAYSLDQELFTIPTNGIALSTLCHRVYGKPLNKDCQAWIGEQDELVDDDQKEYAVMDALTPILLYHKLESALNCHLDRNEFYVNCSARDTMNLGEVLLDQPLDMMRLFLDQVKIRYQFITNYTYDSLEKDLSQGNKYFITTDKYILTSGRYKNLLAITNLQEFKRKFCEEWGVPLPVKKKHNKKQAVEDAIDEDKYVRL